MSGGSQHNPNGRQSQLGSGWSPLQLQMANLLARAPQAHMASDRGVTWHTPTPPPHLYHVPAPSPPDPLQGLLQLQALKSASGNSVFRHTATPPELYRHTPTPPDKHHMRHTPSPGDIKASAALPPVDLYQHLAPSRADKLRADELLAYTRVGVDLSLGGGRAANGAPAPASAPAPAPAPALSVRDAPTINSLIARAQPRHAHAHSRVDALLERLVPSPVSPHSVIMHSRAAPTPSPPDSNEDSADSCGAPPGSKRKRKPERTVRLAAAPPPPVPPAVAVPAPTPSAPAPPGPAAPRVSSPPSPPAAPAPPRENGDAAHAKTDVPDERPASPRPEQPHARRKTRSGSAETIDDIAAMIADTGRTPPVVLPPVTSPAAAVTVDKLRSVLASPDVARAEPAPPPAAAPDLPPSPNAPTASPGTPPAAPPAPVAPRRRSARTSNPEAPNVPVESPSEAKPAETEAGDARSAEPAAASFVEVENQLEKMFAGLEEDPLGSPATARTEATAASADEAAAPAAARKRRRSAPARSDRRQRAQPVDHASRKKTQRKKTDPRRPRNVPRETTRDAYDSGSNASSSKSRGPYIQIRGPRDSPLSVSVMNTSTGEEEEAGARRKGDE